MTSGKYIHKSNQGFQKGHKIGLGNKYCLGKCCSEATKIKMSKAHIEEKAYNWKGWKGDDVEYSALHRWIESRKPKPEFCEKCRENKRLCLANMKNHKYTRNPKDYKWLCWKCHSKLDFPDGLKGKNLKGN